MKKIIIPILIIVMLMTCSLAETLVSLGTDAIEGYSSATDSYEHVYYGKYNNNSIKWRVLDTTSNDGSTPALFMLSEYTLGNQVFRSDYSASDANQWNASDIKTYLQGEFTDSSFDLVEKDAIIATTKTNDTAATDYYGNTLGATNLDNEKLFLLSGSEAVNTKYGFSSESGGDENRKARSISAPSGSAVSWWLRSPYSHYTNAAGYVASDGWVDNMDVSVDDGLRPALNINPASVLFTSAAVGGKSSVAVGDVGIFKLEESIPTEHKLTLIDATRNFTIENVNISASQGDIVSISYSGATVGNNEYISIMIVDENNIPIYYGRILNVDIEDKTNGLVNIRIPADIEDGEYTLKVFTEQYNGDYETDYASAFCDVALRIDSQGIELKTDSFNIDNSDISVIKGETISIAYKDATINEDEYIGGSLWQDNHPISKHDKLAHLNEEYGRIVLDTTVLEPGEYILKLFTEVYKGGYYSNSDISANKVKITIYPRDTNISFGTGTIEGYNSESNSYEYIYYGTYAGEPIKWRVLDTTSNDGSTPALFMMSEYYLGQQKFNSATSKGNTWSTSDIKTYVETTFTNSSFKAGEKEAILYTTTTADEDVVYSGSNKFKATNLNDEQVFLLSASEMINPVYGFNSSRSNSDNNRKSISVTTPTGSASNWWLRSGYSSGTNRTAYISSSGSMSYGTVTSNYGVRPAFNLNPSYVLFLSAAEGDKSGVVDGEIGRLMTPLSTSYKVTLIDSTRNFAVNTTGLTFNKGQTTLIPYSGATVGDNEYISAFIVKDNKPKYYGRILKPTSTSGTLEITIPEELEDGEYILRIFSEQYNGDYKTDYASAFCDIELELSASIIYSTASGITPNAIEVESNSRIILPELKETGKKFLGWYKSDDTEFTSNDFVEGNITLNAKWEDDTTVNNTPNIPDMSGANKPELYQGLKPIRYDSNGNVIFTNASDPNWYNYSAGKWANAVTVDEENNITGYYVWIPRYAYLIRTGYGSSDVGRIDIRFMQGTTNKDKAGKEYYTVDNLENTAEKWEGPNNITYVGDRQMAYLVHPAFRFGNEVPGIWVAKYETGKTLDGNLVSIPNAMLFNKSHIVNAFVSIREMTDNNLYGLSSASNSHLIKPTEYGAVLYLEESIYEPQQDYKVRNLDKIKEYTSGYLVGTESKYNDIYTDEFGDIIDVKGTGYLETSDGTKSWYGEDITPLTGVMVKEDRFGTLSADGRPSEDIGFRIVLSKE